MRITSIFSFSDKGPRAENQDSFCVEQIDDLFLAAVADGVGGNNGGKSASEIAINIAKEMFFNHSNFNEILDRANSKIIEIAGSDSSLQGMATTLSAIVFNGTSIIGAHCGDSRVYVLRGNGIKQLTEDHTEVAKLLAEGTLTKKDAINYPRKNVLTSALGSTKTLIKSYFEFNVVQNDRILLLTDGVYSLLTKAEIQHISSAEPNLETFCEKILLGAKEKGLIDNYTLIGVQF